MIDLARELQCGRQGCSCARNGDTHCPATQNHKGGDKNPSLTVTVEGDRVLFFCHKGCSQPDVVAGLTARALWPLTDAQPNVTPISRGRERLVASYEFRDASGELIAIHDRVETGPGEKAFRWRTPTNEHGLSPIKETDLPLYNLRGILEQPDVPVWVVEGEKAADACTEAGLVATTLAGGASQKKFGNTLDPLLTRDVILWPDNDDAGRQLMANVHAVLDHAQTVQPSVPAKGDAADYFAAGGTVGALEDLVRSNEPSVEVVDNEIAIVTYPTVAATVTFTFSGFSIQRRTIEARMEVAVERIRASYETRLNLLSSSGRDSIRREMEKVFKARSEIEWAAIMPDACTMAAKAFKEIDRSVDLTDTEVVPERRWAINGVAPADAATIIFGLGGSAKSLIAEDIGIHVLHHEPWMERQTMGAPGVLMVDYEDTEDEWRLRIHELCAGHGWEIPFGFRFMPGGAVPLADQAETVKRMIKKYDIRLMIVDSAMSACGGALTDTVEVGRLMNFCSSLPLTTILIAHTVKPPNAKDDQAGAWSKHPFGSIMWTNLSRATHFVEATQSEGSRLLTANLWNRKGNRGLQRPIPLTVTFPPNDGGPVTITHDHRTPIDQTASESTGGGQKWKIARELEGQTKTVGAIAIATGITQDNVRAVLNRHAGDLFEKVDGTNPTVWAGIPPAAADVM